MLKKFLSNLKNRICFHEWERMWMVGLKRTNGHLEPIYLYRCTKCGKKIKRSDFGVNEFY